MQIKINKILGFDVFVLKCKTFRIIVSTISRVFEQSRRKKYRAYLVIHVNRRMDLEALEIPRVDSPCVPTSFHQMSQDATHEDRKWKTSTLFSANIVQVMILCIIPT